MGVFQKIFNSLVLMKEVPQQLQIDSTHIKVHRTAASLLKKGILIVPLEEQKGGLNSKIHAVTDGNPILFEITAGNVSDYTVAERIIEDLPASDVLLADKGYDSNGFRNALKYKNITPCIPGRKHRKKQISYDKKLYKNRHKIENSFSFLKDWSRISTRYDRCIHNSYFLFNCTNCLYRQILSVMANSNKRS